MKNNTENQLNAVVERVLNGELTPAQFVSEAMSLGMTVTPGTTVAVLDDPTYPYAGQRGKVKGKPVNGQVDVEFANGTTVPLQVSLLVPV